MSCLGWLILLVGCIVIASRRTKRPSAPRPTIAPAPASDDLARRERAGRVGERAVAAELAKLPSEYVVLNDVHLDAGERLLFDGKNIRGAQIDHVVVGPCGVVVVETKQWSESFALSGEGRDPFEQTACARRICLHLLRAARLPEVVGDVVAYMCAAPSEPPGDRTRLRHVTKLRSFVLRKRRTLDAVEVGRIVAFLRLHDAAVQARSLSLTVLREARARS